MSDFTDLVLERRLAFAQWEESQALALRDRLLAIRQKAMEELAALRQLADVDGSLEGRMREVRASIADIDRTIKVTLGDAQSALKQLKLESLERSIIDLQYVETMSGVARGQATASFNQIFKAAVKNMATKPVLGVRVGEEFENVGNWARGRTKEILSGALVEGASIDDASLELQQALGIEERAATRIARTNINAAANDAHISYIKENPTIYAGMRWVATADERTCAVCGARDGEFYAMDAQPIIPPHPNCRCRMIGVLLDDDAQRMADAGDKRVRDYGPDGEERGNILVPKKQSFETYLRSQPAIIQQKILGTQVKYDLWKDGRISLSELTTPDMRQRTNADIVRRVLAKAPSDRELQKLADKLGVREVKWSTIEAEDAAARQRMRNKKALGYAPGSDAKRAEIRERAKRQDLELEQRKKNVQRIYLRRRGG